MEAKIYVGTYKKYNEGSLAGKWLDVDDFSNAEEFYAECKKLHADESDPEFMFQDWEDIPDELISECWLGETLFDFVEAGTASHLDYEAFLAGADLGIPWDKIEEAYHGEWRSDEDFVTDLLDGSDGIPDLPNYIHIDWEGTARDIMMDYAESRGHYFNSNW